MKRRGWGLALCVGLAVCAGAGPAGAAPVSSLRPGDPIMVGASRCTLGFVFANGANLASAVTAAHCGPAGSVVTTVDGTRIGTIGDVQTGQVDIARIDISTGLTVYADVGGAVVDDVLGGQAVTEQRPMLCRRGEATAMTCGPVVGQASESYVRFLAASDQGDAGAPVYAVGRDGTLFAVGVLEGAQKDRPDIAVATLVGPFLSTWRLRVSR